MQVSVLRLLNKILCYRWYKWPGICKIQYIYLLKTDKGSKGFMYKVDWQSPLEEFAHL